MSVSSQHQTRRNGSGALDRLIGADAYLSNGKVYMRLDVIEIWIMFYQALLQHSTFGKKGTLLGVTNKIVKC